jgi:hypothetical protein
MAMPPVDLPTGYLADTLFQVQQLIDMIRIFRDQQIELYTTPSPTTVVTDNDGNPVTIPSWSSYSTSSSSGIFIGLSNAVAANAQGLLTQGLQLSTLTTSLGQITAQQAVATNSINSLILTIGSIQSQINQGLTLSKWSVARTFTLTGQAHGSVAFDGSTDFSMAVSIPDNALEQTAIIGLPNALNTLSTQLGQVTSSLGIVETQLISAQEDIEGKLDATAPAVSAQTLTTPREINGVPFDGSQNITIVAPSGTLVVTQMSAATTWFVNHNLNKYPSVTTLDSAGNEVEGVVTYIDLNNLQVDYAAAMAGETLLN